MSGAATAVVLDVFGTIVIPPSPSIGLSLAARSGVPPDDPWSYVIAGGFAAGVLCHAAGAPFRAVRRVLQTHRFGDAAAAARAVERLGARSIPLDVVDRFAQLQAEWVAGYRLAPDADELFASLDENPRIPRALLSNADNWSGGCIAQFGLDRRVDWIGLSCDLGAVKPARVVFETACRALVVPARNVWMVGDSLTSDIAGARSAGLAAIWIDAPDGAPACDEPRYPLAAVAKIVRRSHAA
ncbi:MAG: HAD family hydrolase [Kofleriaceae bacterium]